MSESASKRILMVEDEEDIAFLIRYMLERHGFVVDHVVSRSVRDSALLLDLTHGPDPLAPYAARPPRGSFAAAAARDPGRLKLGVYRGSPLGMEISADTLAALDTAAALAREGGHTVEEIDLPMANRAFMADFARCVASAIAGFTRQEAAELPFICSDAADELEKHF